VVADKEVRMIGEENFLVGRYCQKTLALVVDRTKKDLRNIEIGLVEFVVVELLFG